MIQATKATGIQQDFRIVAGSSDTSINKDTTANNSITINDPKKDFTNLFTTAVTGDGVNGARLNPTAINFVQGYINRNQQL